MLPLNTAGLVFLFLLLSQARISAAADDLPQAVEFRGNVYLSLNTLADATGGKIGFAGHSSPIGIQPLEFTVGQNKWQFPNGGDRILVLPTRKEVLLRNPLLVIKGQHYCPLEEAAAILHYEVKQDNGALLLVSEKAVSLKPVVIDNKYFVHKVEQLRPIHRVLVTTALINVRRSLYKPNDVKELPKGSTILVRRTVVQDGILSAVITDCGPDLESYLVDAQLLEKNSLPRKLNRSFWASARRWFDARAAKGNGLSHGDRTKLVKQACLTVDLCWSLQPVERVLLAMVKDKAAAAGQKVAPVLFVSGRWIQQHPEEMRELIEFDHQPNIQVTWGLHSWAHPKYGNFLNEYDRDQLWQDDLRLEHLLLEWGIVPSVFYRFPGLIHDQERLQAILDLDLFPIDCDSWMAIVERQKNRASKGPFGQPVTDGSIILVHGNGNETEGIAALKKWLDQHSDWSFTPVQRYIQTEN